MKIPQYQNPQTHIQIWLLKTFEEEEVVSHVWVVVDLLQGQIHSFLVGFSQLTVGLLSFSAAEEGSNQQRDSCDKRHLSTTLYTLLRSFSVRK